MVHANGTASGHLGPEEQEHHQTLLKLEHEVRNCVESLSNTKPGAPKTTLNMLDRQIQEKMAQLRSHIRDLELLGEEQDT